ncbi:hypothetical protein B0J13DRAFT_50985 [Dactylonectria estremocensis]|uniref:ER transporter 6TM N-terminal domain-containing protein n=1 Tax=Dactylonectria estremocensis TaxID=1079267 RepID=A0A9P9J0A3_9HYPO|nr:hypothetical protein B0J13DRAFT_50985 [Dactylonectria estremocensis]
MLSQNHGSGSQEESIDRQVPSSKHGQYQGKKLPKWLDHFNANDFKVFFRCWAAVWVATLFIFINPTLNHIGLASFLGAILLFIAPPAGILFVYLLAALSLLLGMCLAWAWGLLTMKAAFAARPDSTTQAKLGALQQQAVAMANQTGQSVAWEANVLIHDGFMLDAPVTAIFYVMGCVFVYTLSRLRCANPKLILMHIFGMLVTDIFILVGPTLPGFLGSLASVLVKPCATGAGIGTACCLLFFPQSASYVVLDQLEKLIRMSDTPLRFTGERLDDQTVPLAVLKGTRAGMIALYKTVQPSAAFLPLDFSRGWWSADDLHDLQERAREVMYGGLYLLDFHIARILAAEKQEELSKSSPDAMVGATPEREKYQIGRRHRLEMATLWNILQNPENGEMRTRTRKMMRETTSEVLRLGSQSVQLAAEYIHAVNTCRWIRKPSPARFDELNRNLHDTLAALRLAKEICVMNATKGVLDNHAELFDEDGLLKLEEGADRPFLPSMIVSMVIEERILGMVGAVEKLLEHILHLAQTRTTQHFWAPSRLQYAKSWLFNGRVNIAVSGASNAEDPDITDPVTFEEQAQELHRRLKVSRGYHGSSAARRNKFSRALIATCNWFTNSSGMFALRMVVVTIATSIPASLPQTAGFFYREKGIWVVISAQTCLLVYMADFSFSIVSRTLGTVIGGVMGMVAWYIGSGNGPGNPYGMGAITAFMIVPLIWWRIFLPPAFTQATIMGGATFALVVGFSWDEDHIHQYGLPGKGYEAFWKRLVTVLLGFAAALIVQLFPSPPSATSHVCKTLANSVRTLSDHYALLVSHWGRPEQNSALGAVTRQLSLEVAEILLSLNPAIALLKGELSFGPFDSKTLKHTQEQCEYMNQALGGLLNQAASLPVELQQRHVHVMGMLDDQSIGDVMAVLGIIEQALRTGSPIPERLPAPLVRRVVDFYNIQDPASMLTTALIKDESYRRYCVAVMLYLKLLTSIDDLLLVLKGALGERHIIYQWEDVERH